MTVTICGGTLNALILISTLYHLSMQGNTKTLPKEKITDENKKCLNIELSVHVYFPALLRRVELYFPISLTDRHIYLSALLIHPPPPPPLNYDVCTWPLCSKKFS